MEVSRASMKVLLFLGIIFPQTSAVTHTLQYLYTALTPGMNFPEFTAVGLVDGQNIVYYDSSIMKMIPKTAWIQKINADDKDYWKTSTQEMQSDQEDLHHLLLTVMKDVNHTKVPPTASVFQKHSSPEVVCHATGFFPKTVMITWQKDGEDVHEDVELRETLPNQDGSFQKRSILTVSAEDLQKHTYTCVIQHSSLEKPPSEGPNLRGGAPIGIIVGAVVVLLVLVAVVAGIVVWKKKKNSGERRKEADVKFSENRFTLSNS
ncbi:hypothetical protein AMELA_G00242520 [Ameiurus melas]|uniref:Ig-like domain-containing protein n=1 Tax=Ameiurus melas TaxID=219545 RepID=A0A7J5ZXQ9_AMEME|nr:hypothetical protein AMELA_G00242520 [Ameiurus melas]